MRITHLSYQIFLALLVCFICFNPMKSSAAEIYLSPEISYLTGATGEEFQLELKVDASTIGLRLFQVYIKFESSLLDTVSSEIGPLFDTSGFSVYYNMKLVYDSTTSDSLLKIEGLLLGATSVVDGPGTVAILTLKTVESGIADLSIQSYTLTDINNDTIPATSIGAVAYIQTPPNSFNLLTPNVAEVITKFPGDSIEFVWESSVSVYPGENIVYELEYSSDNSFSAMNTTIVSSLLDTSYIVQVDDLVNGYVFWRVKAIGDIYSYEKKSNPDPSFFDFIFDTQEPNVFNLLSPTLGLLENLIGDDSILFDWENALPGSPGDTVVYTFYIGATMIFPSTPLLEVQAGTTSDILISSSSLPYCQEVFWTVEAKNQFGLSRWANSVNAITFIGRGDVDCSGGTVPIDIADIVYLVAFMFNAGPAPVVLETGNVDCSGGSVPIDIADLVFLVSYSFSNGPLPSCDL